MPSRSCVSKVLPATLRATPSADRGWASAGKSADAVAGPFVAAVPAGEIPVAGAVIRAALTFTGAPIAKPLALHSASIAASHAYL